MDRRARRRAVISPWRCRKDARPIAETKTPHGRLSDDQKAIIGQLQALGHSWAVVLSIDDARRELARLGITTREARVRASA